MTNILDENLPMDAFKELRTALESNLTILQGWLNRETEYPVQEVLKKRIAATDYALRLITSDKRAATLALLDASDKSGCDNVLVTGLTNIMCWDDEMQGEYGSPEKCASHFLNQYKVTA